MFDDKKLLKNKNKKFEIVSTKYYSIKAFYFTIDFLVLISSTGKVSDS